MRWIAGMLLVAMLASAQAFAQVPGVTGKGIKAGVNLANFTGDDADWEGQEGRTGLAAGAFIEYSFSDIFAIQPEVLYAMKGAGTDTATYMGLGKYEDSIKLDYLEIPILLKINIPTNGGVKPGLFIGPAIAFLLSAEFHYEESVLGFTLVDVTRDAKDSYKSMDVGLVMGAGVAVPAGKGKLTLDVRYNLGLSSVWDESGTDWDAKNSVVAIMGGYSF